MERKTVAITDHDGQLGRDFKPPVYEAAGWSHSGHQGGNHVSDLPQEDGVDRLEHMEEQLKKATAMLGEALAREG